MTTMRKCDGPDCPTEASWTGNQDRWYTLTYPGDIDFHFHTRACLVAWVLHIDEHQKGGYTSANGLIPRLKDAEAKMRGYDLSYGEVAGFLNTLAVIQACLKEVLQ